MLISFSFFFRKIKTSSFNQNVCGACFVLFLCVFCFFVVFVFFYLLLFLLCACVCVCLCVSVCVVVTVVVVFFFHQPVSHRALLCGSKTIWVSVAHHYCQCPLCSVSSNQSQHICVVSATSHSTFVLFQQPVTAHLCSLSSSQPQYLSRPHETPKQWVDHFRGSCCVKWKMNSLPAPAFLTALKYCSTLYT